MQIFTQAKALIKEKNNNNKSKLAQHLAAPHRSHGPYSWGTKMILYHYISIVIVRKDSIKQRTPFSG